MVNYQKLYTLLFNAYTDALEAMESMDYERAKALLIHAQQQAEDCYIEEETE